MWEIGERGLHFPLTEKLDPTLCGVSDFEMMNDAEKQSSLSAVSGQFVRMGGSPSASNYAMVIKPPMLLVGP